MSDAKTNLLHRWFEEVWNQGRLEAVDELAAPDVVGHGLTDAKGNEVAGREAFKEFWHQFRGAFPDVQIDVEDSFAEGDKVVVRCTVRATHTGDGMGMAPTQRPINFSGTCIARVKDGQMTEVWNNFDFLSVYQQLGALPASFA